MTTQTLPSRTEPRRRLRRFPWGSVVAGTAALAFVVAALAPSLLAPGDPYALNLDDSLLAPNWAHPFGTDVQGRDLYTRVVHGAGLSLWIGVGATVVSMVTAVILGSLAALAQRIPHVGRGVGALVNRIIEIQFAFPTLLLALLLVAITGPSATAQVFAVAIGTAPGYARMIRAQILKAMNSGYVEAATTLGHPFSRVLLRHVLPNALRPFVGVIAMCIGQSIVWASSLAFLGLGVAPPNPEWGALLDAGRPYVVQAPWLTVIPGLVIVALAVTATALGRKLQDVLEKEETR
ncbi:MAG: ABC transporter permease [Galactobacter sp.]